MTDLDKVARRQWFGFGMAALALIMAGVVVMKDQEWLMIPSMAIFVIGAFIVVCASRS